MVVSGALAYAFHVIAARTLGPHAYGQVAILWAAIFLVAIMLFRPLEQTASRAVADRLARGDEVRSVLRAVGLATATIALLGAVVTALAWGEITERIFLGNDYMTALLAAGIAAYGLQYITRGMLAGSRWFGGYGLGLVADALGRLLVAAPLVFVASQSLAALALVAAGLAGALVPLVVGRKVLRTLFAAHSGPGFGAGAAFAFAAPATIIAAADQLLTNGAPLLVIAGNGKEASAAAGLVLAATMLVRAPLYVFQGLAASLLPNLTHLAAVQELARFRRAVVRTSLFLLGGGAVIVAGAATLGPAAMGIYGSEFVAGRTELSLLGAGVGFYLAAATISQALLALDNGRSAAAAWGLSALAFVGAYAALPGGELMRVSLAFAVATLFGLLLIAAVLGRRIGVR
jgi:O-antigen/teichoic acid export membrane protein